MIPAFDRLAIASILCLAVVTAGVLHPTPFGIRGADDEVDGQPQEAPGGKVLSLDLKISNPNFDGQKATIIRVFDGDTVEVRLENGSRATVRLVGIDTPEVTGRPQPWEFEGVPGTSAGRSCLRDVGRRATHYLRGLIGNETVQLQYDPNEARRGVYDRLLTYVVLRGENINYRLVRQGFARVYDSDFSLGAVFYRAERGARAAGAGVWGCP